MCLVEVLKLMYFVLFSNFIDRRRCSGCYFEWFLKRLILFIERFSVWRESDVLEEFIK